MLRRGGEHDGTEWRSVALIEHGQMAAELARQKRQVARCTRTRAREVLRKPGP